MPEWLASLLDDELTKQLLWLWASWLVLVGLVAKLFGYLEEVTSATGKATMSRWLRQPPSNGLAAVQKVGLTAYQQVFATPGRSLKCFRRAVVITWIFGWSWSLLLAAIFLPMLPKLRSDPVALTLTSLLATGWFALGPGYWTVVVVGSTLPKYLEATSNRDRFKLGMKMGLRASWLLAPWSLMFNFIAPLLLPDLVPRGVRSALVAAVAGIGSTLLPSLWMALFDLRILSGLLDSIHRVFKRWIEIKRKPFKSLGLLVIGLGTCLYVLVWIPLVLLF